MAQSGFKEKIEEDWLNVEVEFEVTDEHDKPQKKESAITSAPKESHSEDHFKKKWEETKKELENFKQQKEAIIYKLQSQVSDLKDKNQKLEQALEVLETQLRNSLLLNEKCEEIMKQQEAQLKLERENNQEHKQKLAQIKDDFDKIKLAIEKPKPETPPSAFPKSQTSNWSFSGFLKDVRQSLEDLKSTDKAATPAVTTTTQKATYK